MILTASMAALMTCVSITDANAFGFGRGPLRRFNTRDTIGTVKIDVDIDFNGIINGRDNKGRNANKRNPFGLVVGTNEMTKLMLTCKPNQDRKPSIGEPTMRMDFYKLVASLEIRGANLADRKGRFSSLEEEVSHCGRILVWLDSSRRYLLLDSSDPTRRRIEWPYGSSVPPERVYVEAVAPTQPGSAFVITYELDDSNRTGLCKLFGEPAVWDRILVSAHNPGMTKPFIDRTPVWKLTGGQGDSTNGK